MVSIQQEILAQRPKLLRYARKLLYDSAIPVDPEDLVQDVLVRALAKADSMRPNSKLAGWLNTILRNRHIDLIRSTRRNGRDLVPLNGQECCGADQEQYFAVLCSEALDYMEKLPTRQFEMLQAIGLEGISYKQAAIRFGVPVGTVKSTVSRAREKLRTYKPQEEDP